MDDHRATEKSRRRMPVRPIQMLPNMMTLGAICAGLTSIRFAMDGNAVLAMSLIVLAAVLDALDGMLARFLKSESAIGAELDSLADFVNFGVAPGMLLYIWVLQHSRSLGWIAVLIYCLCCCMRLARYNVTSKAEPGVTRVVFTGVPAPGGAVLALLPLVLQQNMPELIDPVMSQITAVWLVLVGLMMISRITTPSLKLIRISRDKAPFMMVGVLGVMAAFLTWPWPLLLLAEFGYLAVLARFALKRHPDRDAR
ncbi:CDP-diacylglycerol--serine O-phosphatidyltransferase [Seohaeicola zhoushanensis]|uniref:CDP-diacylglycerol--serine O-phosphatidyltransferase n=1 Tax=Seohaeicola zhoushanensis TaxID=1569283 RepID=A0A8J3H387_9RHOB|nr:CDP-diacylglycerol--serine O-phosphatidyltransferase [Seohaeicola zhoushanensis]GHF72693.1 CDP-diacylglycerol--serine O-phosphatidyltransferase [Seohaeicola zhoushanensis]